VPHRRLLASDVARRYEVEVVHGIEEFASEEILRLPGVENLKSMGPGRLAVDLKGDLRLFNDLRAVTAVHLVLNFGVPRPKALLGHEHFERLTGVIRDVIALYPGGSFSTFRVSAAGSTSSVFTRLTGELATHLGLSIVPEKADLVLAVRRPPDGSFGWQVLVRTTPMPLSVRSWRVHNFPGALNACVANVMVRLAKPSPDDRIVNLMCGSGTILAERLQILPARAVVGVDVSSSALQACERNLRASGGAPGVSLVQADVAKLPMRSRSVDAILADLPYGMLIGSAGELDELYPAFMDEATRIAAPGASMVVITASIRRFEATLRSFSRSWRTWKTVPLRIPFKSGFLRPRIYALETVDR
jgi:ubiquinone/menaquinone biosynthesis C-methylase UbiE